MMASLHSEFGMKTVVDTCASIEILRGYLQLPIQPVLE